MMEAAPPMATPEAARLGVNIQEGVTAAAWGAQAGELFEYTIKASVSLERQKSAMLPILSQAVEGQKVSIYNPAVQPKHPLNGFRLKNATPLHLMQGPITVFDAGAYAGDARIEDLAPSQERLLSYALDLKTECEVLPRGGQQDLITVKLRKGTLIATRKAAEAVDYTVPQPRPQAEGRPGRAPVPPRLEAHRADEGPRAQPRRVSLPCRGRR